MRRSRHPHSSFLIFLNPYTLFQQISILEVIDPHRAADFGEGLGCGVFRFFAAGLQDILDILQMGFPIFTAFADGAESLLHDVIEEALHLHVAEAASRVVILHFLKAAVLGAEGSEVFITAECIEVGEDGISFHMPRVVAAQVGRVGEHGHDLRLDILRRISEVDAVADGLAHLRFAVGAGQAQAGFVCGKDDIWFDKDFAVDVIEFADDLACLLEHRLLVFAGRDMGGLEGRDVARLADRVAEEAGRDAGFEILLLDLRFDSRISLETRNGDEVHVVHGEFGELRHHGLDEDAGLRGIDADSEVVESDLAHISSDLLRIVRIVRERLRVSDHDVDVVEFSGVLQLDTLTQGADVVADMKAAGRAVAGKNDFSHMISPIINGRCIIILFIILHMRGNR